MPNPGLRKTIYRLPVFIGESRQEREEPPDLQLVFASWIKSLKKTKKTAKLPFII